MPVSSVEQPPPGHFRETLHSTYKSSQSDLFKPACCWYKCDASIAVYRTGQLDNCQSEPARYQCQWPISQITTSHIPTGAGEKFLATTSVAGATSQQDPSSNFAQQTDPLWRKKVSFRTKRLVCRNRNWINSFLKSRTPGKLSGVSSRSWGGTKYQNLKVQPLLKIITPLLVPRPSQPAKYQ